MTTDLPLEQPGPDLEVIQTLIDEHFPFDCTLIEIDPHTWAIHGSIPVGGESILAEFGTLADAEAALQRLAAAEQRSNASLDLISRTPISR